MKGSCLRTAIEYTYWFDDEVSRMLSEHYYPNFTLSVEQMIKEMDGVECVDVASGYVVFTINTELTNDMKELERTSTTVSRNIERFAEEFFNQ